MLYGRRVQRLLVTQIHVSQLQVDGLTQKDGSQAFKFIFKPVSLNGSR